MPLWEHYFLPATVAEALELLRNFDGQARVISGGTDLLLELQQGHKPPVSALIDVTAIAEMRQLEMDGDWFMIGAAVPHAEIVASDMMREHAACLVESCGVIGGPQVRNVGTLGGNVGHALPAADGTTALVALNAQAEIASPVAVVWRDVIGLFTGPGLSVLDTGREFITRFRFPAARRGEGSAFKRIMRPQGVALPILACAVWIALVPGAEDSESAVIQDARICVGPVAPVPTRVVEAEQALMGRTLASGLDISIAAAYKSIHPRTSKHRATADYREKMAGVLLQRALPLAVKRAVTGEILPEGVGLQ